jgi:uncharacterized protein
MAAPTQIIEHNQKEAANGNRYAQSFLGTLYFTGKGLPRDYGKAVEWYGKAADQGEVLAQERLYQMYFRGMGVKKDLSQASKWAKRAAESGNVRMQAILGGMYYRGAGVERDHILAVAWVTIAELYGYRHWHHRFFKSMFKKDISEQERFKVIDFINNWQEKRNGKPDT